MVISHKSQSTCISATWSTYTSYTTHSQAARLAVCCCCSSELNSPVMQGPDYDTAVRCAGPAKATAEAHEKAKQLLADTYRNAFALANEVSGLHFVATP